MTNVLQVLPALTNGGVERGTVEMVNALVKAGHKAYVASSGGPMADEVTQAGGHHITLPLASKNPWMMIKNIGRLARLIRRHKIDIVHARSRAPAWSAWYATGKTRAHFMTTFHNAYGAKSAVKRQYNSVMAKGERVIAISHFVANHVVDTYRVPRAILRVIPRGVDIAQFDTASVNPARIIALRQAWRLDPQRPVIMLPGRISGWKGHDILIAAVAQLHNPALQVILVGGGDRAGMQDIDRLIDQHGLGAQIKQVDTCRDMPAAYLLADIVVSPATRPEGFGRVIIEAQAMGRLVIATGHGGACETIIPGETGWLVPPRDATALANAIREALALPPEQKTYRTARAVAHIREHFTTKAMTDATLAVYRELTGVK